MIRWKRLFPLFLGAACAVFLAGCHGSRETEAFQPPETFDETKAYEITFWAKNDTNKRQTDIYKKAIEDSGVIMGKYKGGFLNELWKR